MFIVGLFLGLLIAIGFGALGGSLGARLRNR